jgi:23S rRNA (guanine745-N1)-methyltransferase
MLICPLCKTKLLEEPKRFCCMQGHAYDKAKSGYVNLLVGSSSKSHGDEEAMILSRHRFLSEGHYDPLLKALIDILGSLKISALIDLGCGEGYYTNALERALNIPLVGIDLSKSALKIASKANQNIDYVLANITKTPIADQSTDAVLSIFSPFDLKETQRIAQRYLILVRPGPKHLLQLKENLYEKTLDNPLPVTEFPQSICILEKELHFMMDLNHEAIIDLLMMTPYAHTSPQSGLQKVRDLDHLSILAQFNITVFQFLHASST